MREEHGVVEPTGDRDVAVGGRPRDVEAEEGHHVTLHAGDPLGCRWVPNLDGDRARTVPLDVQAGRVDQLERPHADRELTGIRARPEVVRGIDELGEVAQPVEHDVDEVLCGRQAEPVVRTLTRALDPPGRGARELPRARILARPAAAPLLGRLDGALRAEEGDRLVTEVGERARERVATGRVTRRGRRAQMEQLGTEVGAGISKYGHHVVDAERPERVGDVVRAVVPDGGLAERGGDGAHVDVCVEAAHRLVPGRGEAGRSLVRLG